MRMIQLATVMALMLVAPTLSCAQAPEAFEFRFTEQPGPYAVGLKVYEEHDPTRAFKYGGAASNPTAASQGPRPLQLLLWHPAHSSDRPPMTFGDYEALIRTETSFNKPTEDGASQKFVESFMQGATARPAWSVRDAEPAAGQFPVAIYAPSVNAPNTENVELCEYLASHGYIVIASPSMGADSRHMTVDLIGANAEAQDISFDISFAKGLADAEISRVAVIGYSWGGMGALFAAGRDRRIGALISLDGSFRYAPEIVQRAADLHPDQMTIPLLVFSRAEETLETWAAMHQNSPCQNVPNVLNEWTHGDLLHVHMLALSHIQFSSLFQRSQRFKTEGLHFAPADYSLQEGNESYNWMARYTLEFLDSYLKKDASAVQFLKRTPAENGVPKHLMAVSFRAAVNVQQAKPKQ